MEGWLKDSPASGRGGVRTAQSGSLDYISEETSEWLLRHHFDRFLRFDIPDAQERLWLLPANGKGELERVLLHILGAFSRTQQCMIRMREANMCAYFLLCFPESFVGGEWCKEKERCVVILDRADGAMYISWKTAFSIQMILTAFDCCIGNIHHFCRYDLKGLFWKLNRRLPVAWPFSKMEVAGYTLLTDGNQQILGDRKKSGDFLWNQMAAELRRPGKALLLTKLSVRIAFRDKAVRTYTLYEDHVETLHHDERQNLFLAALAIMGIREVRNVKF